MEGKGNKGEMIEIKENSRSLYNYELISLNDVVATFTIICFYQKGTNKIFEVNHQTCFMFRLTIKPINLLKFCPLSAVCG